MSNGAQVVWYSIALALFLIAAVVVLWRKPTRGPIEIAAIALGLAALTVVPWWSAIQA